MIIRYDVSGSGFIWNYDPEGYWVTYDEHEDIIMDMRLEYIDLQKKYDNLVKEIGYLFRDA